jgi:hypothetical protein
LGANWNDLFVPQRKFERKPECSEWRPAAFEWSDLGIEGGMDLQNKPAAEPQSAKKSRGAKARPVSDCCRSARSVGRAWRKKWQAQKLCLP